MKGTIKRGIVTVLLITFVVGVGLHVVAGNHAQMGEWASKAGYVVGGGIGFLLAVAVIPLVFSLIVLAIRKEFPTEAFTIMCYGMLVILTPLIYKGLKAEKTQTSELITVPGTYGEFAEQGGPKLETLEPAPLMYNSKVVLADSVRIPAKAYQVGGVNVEIPAPVLFYEVTDTSSMASKISQASTPPLNRVIATFVSEEDLTSDKPELQRFMRIQVARKFENRNFTQADFAKLASRIKHQEMTMFADAKTKYQSLLSMLSDSISKVVDVDAEIAIADAIPLGIFDETPYSLSFATLTLFSYDVDGISGGHEMVVGTSLALINGKLIFLYTSSKFRNKNDLDWVRIRQRMWVKSVFYR